METEEEEDGEEGRLLERGQRLGRKVRNVETGFGSFAVRYNFLRPFFQTLLPWAGLYWS